MRRSKNRAARRAHFGIVAVAALSYGETVPARAAILTCDLFESRLQDAVKGASPSAPGAALGPLSFTTARDRGTAGRIVAWSGVPGLSGRLTCGAADAFADFYMLVAPGSWSGSAEAPLAPGFAALAAASICALSAAAAQDCAATAATMTGDGLDQFREDLAHRDDHPQSLQDYDLGTDLDAVFYVTPSAISWAIGPGLFATLDAQRQPLDAQDRDKDE